MLARVRSNGNGSAHLHGEFASPLFQEFDRVFDEIFGDRKNFLNRVRGNNYPRLEVCSRDHKFIVKATVPGLSKEDLVVEMNEGVVTIGGHSSSWDKADGATYHLRELVRSKFSRSIVLPEEIDLDQEPETLLKDGILTLTWKYKMANEVKIEKRKLIEIKADGPPA